MEKNKFYEKVGKSIFSIILTLLLTTGIVIATGLTGTWDELDDNYMITGTNWQKMVAEIKSKVSSTDLGNYYTQSEVDTIISNLTTEPQILPSIKEKSVYFSNEGTKYLSCGSGEQVVSCGMGHNTGGHDDMFCKLDLGNNRCKLTIEKYNGMDNNTYGYCYCSYFENGTWDSGTSVSYTPNCGGSLSTTVESGSCQPGSVNYYYTGRSSCTYMTTRMGNDGEPMVFPTSGYKYSGKKKQTCN